MSHDPEERRRLEQAQVAVAESRKDASRLLAELGAERTAWRHRTRTATQDMAELVAGRTDLDRKRQELRAAIARERQAKDEALQALTAWLAADPAEDMATLSAAFPIALLPVRIETRFVPTGRPRQLLVRIYPDDLMADTHEPELTVAERSAGEAYWRAFWTSASGQPEANDPAAQAVWAKLLDRFPRGRAAWLVEQMTPKNLEARGRPGVNPDFPSPAGRAENWTRPGEARLLPDRWIVVAYRGGEELHRAVGAPIRAPLVLTIDPVLDGDGDTDVSAEQLLDHPELAWSFRFDAAERVGMALRLELTAEDVVLGFDRVLVVGVKASSTPDAGATGLAALLEAHRHTRGLAFVPQGTATNRTSETAPGFPPADPGGKVSIGIERAGLAVEPGSDGHRFMTALGMAPALASHLADANGQEHRNAAAMNDALWPATLGYFAEQMMAGGRATPRFPVRGEDAFGRETLKAARRHFVEYVHGRGPYPAFRVGATPYGLLPATALDRWPGDRTATDAAADLLVLHLAGGKDGDRQGHYRLAGKLDRAGRLAGASQRRPYPLPKGFTGQDVTAAGMTAVTLSDDGSLNLLVLWIGQTDDAKRGAYRVGRGLNAAGGLAGGWTDPPTALPDEVGAAAGAVLGLAAAAADLDGNGRPELVVTDLDAGAAARGDEGRYRVGWDLDAAGRAARWSEPVAIPARTGAGLPVAEIRGLATALTDLDGNGRPELLVFHLGGVAGFDGISYRIGWDLGSDGRVSRWSEPVPVPGSLGHAAQAAAVTVADLDGNGRPDLVLSYLDNIDEPALAWLEACAWGPGRIDVLAFSPAGSLLHRYHADGGWSPWTNLGGEWEDLQAALVAPHPGRLDVVATTDDGRMLHRTYDADTWSAWTDLGEAGGPPVAVSWGPERLDVFASAWDPAVLEHLTWDRDRGPVPERLAHFPSLGPPVVVASQPGRLDVFSVRTDSTLLRLFFAADAWSPVWQELGGGVQPLPAAVARDGGTVDVFAVRSGDGHLLHWACEGENRSQPDDLGGDLARTAGPAAFSIGAGTLDVLAIGTDGSLLHKRFAGTWPDAWETVAGGLGADWKPNVLVSGHDRADVVALLADGTPGHWSFDGTGWTSHELGLPPFRPPAMVSGEPGRVDLVAVGPDDRGIRHRVVGQESTTWDPLLPAVFRVGWNLDAAGNAAGWSDPARLPGRPPKDVRGAGIAVAAVTGAESWPGLLRALRDRWLAAAPRVPRVGRTGDLDRDLLEALGLDASTREVRIRGALGSDLVTNLLQYRGLAFFDLPAETWEAWMAGQEQAIVDWTRGLGPPAWDALLSRPRWRTRIGEMTFNASGDLFRCPLVTGDPQGDPPALPVIPPGMADEFEYRNYIDWIARTTPYSFEEANLLDGLGAGEAAENPPLLYLILRHAMTLEYARVALDLCITQGLATEADRREPELVGIVPGTETRLTLLNRLLLRFPGADDTLGLMLWRGGRPETAELDAYRIGTFGRLADPRLSVTELERLSTETLDLCSHRLDAWITSLAERRLQKMRAVQATGSHLGAFGWVEDLRPAPADRFATATVDGQPALVQHGSGGHIQAPSMVHAAAAAVLRNAHLTRRGTEALTYAVDLSSERVRTARQLLDAIRDGQPLAALLGYRVERILHENELETFIDPLRRKYPILPPQNPVETGETLSARNVVDGLALRAAWRGTPGGLPWGQEGFPNRDSGQAIKLRRALNPEFGVPPAAGEPVGPPADPIDAVADLLTAEAVYQLVRGNMEAASASLDSMAQGVRPPDPEIARTPRGGILLTHRVALLVGEPPPQAPAGWPEPTPRAVAEPHLDGWAGALLGDPSKVICRVSRLAPTPDDPNRLEPLRDVTLLDLQLRPLDLLALAKGVAITAQASELDRRVAYAALRQEGTAATLDADSLRITYAAGPDWIERGLSGFPEALATAEAINALIGGARPLEPADLLPPEAATQAADAVWAVDDAAGRAAAVRDALRDTVAALEAEIARLEPTPPAGAVLALDPMRAALLDAARFGVAGTVPDSGKDLDPGTIGDPAAREAAEALVAARRTALLDQARSVAAEIKRRLASIADVDLGGTDATARRTAATDVVRAALGGDAAFLVGFVPAAATRAELTQALRAGPGLIDGDAAAKSGKVARWLQGAARVRPPLDRWRRLSLYAQALGARQAEPDIVQLPHAAGDRWVALPFAADRPRPPSGKLSLALFRAAAPAADATWTGLLLDSWPEVIPGETGMTGIAYHYDNPGAEAPQAVLLAVPPPGTERWDLETLLATLDETLDLAKARLMDGALLGDLGGILPAILMAANQANDTVSTAFDGLSVGGGVDVR